MASWLVAALLPAALGHAAPAHLQPMIDRVAREERMDPALLEAVMSTESAYKQNAVSSKGAMGLMQLMPGTAKLMRVDNPYNPEENLRGGARYLRGLMNEFSDLPLALAAYNAGPEHVKNYRGIPPFPETRQYVSKVLNRYRYPWSTPSLNLVNPRLVVEPPSKPIYRYRNERGTLVLTDVPPRYRANLQPERKSKLLTPSKPSTAASSPSRVERLFVNDLRDKPNITVWKDGKPTTIQVTNNVNRIVIYNR